MRQGSVGRKSVVVLNVTLEEAECFGAIKKSWFYDPKGLRVREEILNEMKKMMKLNINELECQHKDITN